MAQSRVQQGKGKKSKFPMWGIGIVVVLVVAIAGYAIVRFSQASEQYYVKSANNKELSGGVSYQYKQVSNINVREVGKIPVYTEYFYDQVMGSTTKPEMKTVCVRSYIWTNTAYTIRVESSGVFGIPASIGPHQFKTTTRDWATDCVDITSNFKTNLKNLYSIYKTKPNVRVIVSEDDPDKDYVGVDKIWLTNL